MFTKPLYSVREVLDLIPLSNTALYKAIATGEIDSHRIGRRRVITGQSLVNYVLKVTGPAGKRGAR